jgi:NAD(P)H-binding
MALPDPNLEKVRSDALKLRDVEAALTGVDVVIQTLGVGFGDLFRLLRLFSDATRMLIAAMKAQGVNV